MASNCRAIEDPRGARSGATSAPERPVLGSTRGPEVQEVAISPALFDDLEKELVVFGHDEDRAPAVGAKTLQSREPNCLGRGASKHPAAMSGGGPERQRLPPSR